jgi:glycosyltransferase involved in cell wall biosynthesis
MEGLPTTILEAMACNVPCVCTNHAGIKDIAKNGVFYTDSKDSSELKNLLEKIKFNPELAQQKQQEAASRFHIIFPNSKKSDCHFPYNTILKELSNN